MIFPTEQLKFLQLHNEQCDFWVPSFDSNLLGWVCFLFLLCGVFLTIKKADERLEDSNPSLLFPGHSRAGVKQAGRGWPVSVNVPRCPPLCLW